MEEVYFHLPPNQSIPKLPIDQAFAAVVIIEADVSDAWQNEVSKWLVDSGCLYMMAWGKNCSSWDESVDQANLEIFDNQDIPEASFVCTTWHDNEPLEDVFWFAQNSAQHPTIELSALAVIHVSHSDRREEILNKFLFAQYRDV